MGSKDKAIKKSLSQSRHVSDAPCCAITDTYTDRGYVSTRLERELPNVLIAMGGQRCDLPTRARDDVER